MARIALLVNKTPRVEDGNYLRFARELYKLEHQVGILFADSLKFFSGQIKANMVSWLPNLRPGSLFPKARECIVDHDVIWVLGLGNKSTFLDKYQLLYILSERCKVINSLETIMHLKSKYYIARADSKFPCPETHASNSAEELISFIKLNEGRWIVKPPAGSLGKDVYLTHAKDSQLTSIIKRLCGQDNDKYAMVQRYVPQVELGEKRVLLAGGQVMGQYLRSPAKDHRTNITAGAKIKTCNLTESELVYCNQLAQQVLSKGAWFAGIDLIYPWVIELNVINPGGIITIEGLTGFDLSGKVVAAVMSTL